MTEFFTAYGWAIVLVVNFIIGLIVWSMRNTFASKSDHGKLAARVERVETKIENLPNAQRMEALTVSLERTNGNVKALTARLDGLEKMTSKLDEITSRQETYLLNGGGK